MRKKLLLVIFGAFGLFVAWRGIQYYQWSAKQEAQHAAEASAFAARKAQWSTDADRVREDFASRKQELLNQLRSLVSARRWDEASKLVSAYGVVKDPEFTTLTTVVREGMATAEKAKLDAQKATADKADRERRRHEGVRVGMTMNDVLLSSWGRPENVNKTVTTRGTSEQWIYRGNQYLYFDNGVLTAIQTH